MFDWNENPIIMALFYTSIAQELNKKRVSQ